MVIVGCKADLEDERVVSYEMARDFADKRGALLEVSNKDSTNIEWAQVYYPRCCIRMDVL